MPNLIFSNEDLTFLLDTFLATPHTSSLVLRLFDNNVTISATTISTDLNEASFAGYAGVTLVFPASILNSAVPDAETTSNICVYIDTDTVGVFTIYGAYVLDPANGILLCAYNFTAPLTVDPANPAVVAQLQITLASKF